MAPKDVWKCAMGVCGALSVEICGTTWTLKLSVTSLDSQPQVGFHIYMYKGSIMDGILVYTFSEKSFT